MIGQLVFRYQASTGEVWYTYLVDGMAKLGTDKIFPEGELYWAPTQNIFDTPMLQNKKIIQIGIQAPPGSIIEIDAGFFYIGASGILELDLSNQDAQDIRFYNNYSNIILDFVYTEREGE